MKNKTLLITSLIAVAGCLLSLTLILQLDIFTWDEAHHAFFGNLIYRDLKSFNISAFFSDTGRQAWFQPFHSYLNGLFFLVFGKSYLSARLSSLFMFFLLFFAVYRVSTLISKEKGWIIALIANLLMATSPKMLVMSSLNLQEIMGALVILGSLMFYVSRCKNNDPVNYLILGLILSLVLLVKYHYGILLGGAIFLIEFSRIFDVRDKLSAIKVWIINNFLIFAGFFPLTALWFLTPPVGRKIGLLLFRFKDVQGWGRGLNLFQRALFYIQTIITDYTFSLWIGIFLVFVILYSFRYFHNLELRSLLFLFLTFFIFHSCINEVYERLIGPAMPSVYILAGYCAVDIYGKYLKSVNKVFLSILYLITIIVLLGDLRYLLPYSKEVANYSESVFAFKQNVQDINPPFLFKLVKRPNIFLPPNPAVLNYPRFAEKPKNRVRDVLKYCSDAIPKGKNISTLMSLQEISPYELYWHFSDWGANVFTVNDYNIAGKYFWFSEYFIEFDIKASSPYHAEVVDDCMNRWKDLSKPFKQRGWLTLYSSREFKDLGITANIYKMKLPF